MLLTVTKVWPRMTLDVGSLALASTQVLYRYIILRIAIFHADVRWTGEEALANDPKLLSLKDKYLKIREGKGRLRNIAFNANATGGGEIKK